MTVASQFAANVVQARERAGISQEELGVRASLHRTEISQIERGLRQPRIDTLAKLCGSLDVEPSELMEGIVWTPGEIHLGSFRSVASADDC